VAFHAENTLACRGCNNVSQQQQMKKNRSKTFLTILLAAVLFGFMGFYPGNGFSLNPSDNKKTASLSRPGNAPGSRSGFIGQVYKNITTSGTRLSEELLTLAITGFDKLDSQGKLSPDSILTIIDYSKSSKEKRMFVVDLKTQQMLFETVVAHGRNSGEEFARSFSNKVRSHQSSLGFYITGRPYKGSNGYSLVLEGLEKGFNDKARERAIVVHGAAYASESMIGMKGYLGRSFGCPSLPPSLNNKVIDRIKDGNCLFIYYPSQTYLKQSEILNG
jgi:hypothetical protein